jgi:hypothetical protein
MKVLHSLIASALIALPLGLLSTAAAAQGTDLSRVEVEGKTLPLLSRTDVHKACSHLDSSLSEDLAQAWASNQKVGEVHVQFELLGGEIQGVSTHGGPREYHQAIRRAVHYLDCQTDASATQQFSFIVAFKESEDEPGQMKMAFLERQ